VGEDLLTGSNLGLGIRAQGLVYLQQGL
jgi:hypothetical protein